MVSLSLIYRFWFCFLFSFLVLGSHGVKIELYKHPNFTGLVWESSSTAACVNVPNVNQVMSIRTDTCFITYYLLQNCKSYWSEKYLPGEIDLSYNRLGWSKSRLIFSFHVCNEEEGGNELNVDLTKQRSVSDQSPVVLESYKNVCQCVNVPQYVQQMYAWSFDNHHNDLLAYNEPDCMENKWNSTFIKAGYHRYSNNMPYLQKTDSGTDTTYKIQSFGPDPDSTYFQTSCRSLHVIQTEIPEFFESTTLSVTSVNADHINHACNCQDWTNQIMELQTQFNQFKSHHEATMQDQFNNFTESKTKLQEEFTQNYQLLSEKMHTLENELDKKMKTQNEEFLEVIARLRAFLQNKL